MIEPEVHGSLTADAQSGKADNPDIHGENVNESQFEPGQPGLGVPIPLHCGETHTKGERRRTGPQPTLEGNIDKAIDKTEHTVNKTRAQGHAMRWLLSNYSITAAVAVIILTELRMGGSQ
jgi:hypothetical protein